MTITAKQAKASGYCITSRRAPTWATRIDRKDWREHMAAQHPRGMEWVKCLGDRAADHYRRCFSKDTIVVHSGWVKLLPNSGQGPTEFMPSNTYYTASPNIALYGNSNILYDRREKNGTNL